MKIPHKFHMKGYPKNKNKKKPLQIIQTIDYREQLTIVKSQESQGSSS